MKERFAPVCSRHLHYVRLRGLFRKHSEIYRKIAGHSVFKGKRTSFRVFTGFYRFDKKTLFRSVQAHLRISRRVDYRRAAVITLRRRLHERRIVFGNLKFVGVVFEYIFGVLTSQRVDEINRNQSRNCEHNRYYKQKRQRNKVYFSRFFSHRFSPFILKTIWKCLPSPDKNPTSYQRIPSFRPIILRAKFSFLSTDWQTLLSEPWTLTDSSTTRFW